MQLEKLLLITRGHKSSTPISKYNTNLKSVEFEISLPQHPKKEIIQSSMNYSQTSIIIANKQNKFGKMIM